MSVPKLNFPERLKLALDAAFKKSDGEPVKLGNVLFDSDDVGRYHVLPARAWDIAAVAADVEKILAERK